ncbi:hypothetical protein BU26DRAFT_522211 [Trematosphaeria pertusa]|uniref:Uncharacterized protein n=1 Tax=Trematosphaeria pertusa TaxID=390896 RepID=A0A6A6I4X7_9PLEO|nr:uncharacterized protein BU26DRAFT_522211 [Trematosphaeria pertusa]KAF2245088.1 hypothetical protein BU26DRAFT_522211 [Trematosphaeria pertusa]
MRKWVKRLLAVEIPESWDVVRRMLERHAEDRITADELEKRTAQLNVDTLGTASSTDKGVDTLVLKQ